MAVSHKKYFLSLLVFLFLLADIYPQIKNVENSFLQQNLIISLESGVSYGFTDYKTSNFEPLIRGSFEYYPIVFDNARFGLKIFGGGTRLSQSDNRGFISNNDLPNPRQMPAETYTDIIQIGGSLNFGYAISESIIPYLSVGGAYFNFSPKNSNGTILEFNSKGKYNKNIFSFVVEGGIQYQLSDRFSLNAAVSYFPTSTDYLEDISASKKMIHSYQEYLEFPTHLWEEAILMKMVWKINMIYAQILLKE